MSKRAAQMLQEYIEFMGPARLRDIEETQQKIVAICRLPHRRIIIARGGEDEVIV